ncbi:hypothetical protein MMC28_005967 [Mycoblastus sanguinarius]|nr:hypothetical protein [Mycoblastus sanguinarius]
MSASQCNASASSPKTESQLLALPFEVQLSIIPHLPYPDALALKHTNCHFYNLIDTSVKLKVAWLLDRKVHGLDWPQKKCIMKTDAAFCSSGGGEVRKIMEKRRAHQECAAREAGCEVVPGSNCGGGRYVRKGREGRTMWARKMRRPVSWLAMWVFGLLVMSVVVNLGFSVRWYWNHAY